MHWTNGTLLTSMESFTIVLVHGSKRHLLPIPIFIHYILKLYIYIVLEWPLSKLKNPKGLVNLKRHTILIIEYGRMHDELLRIYYIKMGICKICLLEPCTSTTVKDFIDLATFHTHTHISYPNEFFLCIIIIFPSSFLIPLYFPDVLFLNLGSITHMTI